MLTSARAVWGATSLKLATGLGILHGRIVARAPCDGLALVETQPRIPGLVSLAAGPAASPAPGALVTALRAAARQARRPPPAQASRPRVLSAPLRLDAPLVPEAAGGPILDATGGRRAIAAADGSHDRPGTSIRERLAELRPARGACSSAGAPSTAARRG